VKFVELLKCVHQSRDGAVEVFVGAAHLFDLVDRVEHRRVMLAAELAADLRQRRGGELLHDVHRDLSRESDGARVAADFQILLAQVEVLADALLNQVDRNALFLRRDDVAQDLLSGRE
jgi:hypothetical protein